MSAGGERGADPPAGKPLRSLGEHQGPPYGPSGEIVEDRSSGADASPRYPSGVSSNPGMFAYPRQPLESPTMIRSLLPRHARGSLILLLLATAACGDKDAEGTTAPCEDATWTWDGDSDGYGDSRVYQVSCEAPSGWVLAAGDCDDDDDEVNPGAAEDCADQRDLDCDGDNAWADNDEDGSPACEDCDDTDEQRAPSLAEVCDEVDNDCDELVDAADPDLDLDTAETWWADLDDDGYGDPTSSQQACGQPDNHTDNDGDCDDSDDGIHPGAEPICDDVDIDRDCDGVADHASCVEVADRLLSVADAKEPSEGPLCPCPYEFANRGPIDDFE
jgi:hypothetical protein